METTALTDSEMAAFHDYVATITFPPNPNRNRDNTLRAMKTLDELIAGGHAGSFDFAFIDADKGNYLNYYERALALLRPGGLLAVDNVLWGGAVAGDLDQDEDTRAIRAFNAKLATDERVFLSLVPIGDGLTLAVKSDVTGQQR